MPVLLRLCLGAVFGAAAASKIADRRGTTKALLEFGVPERMSGALAVALPVVEFATAFGLFVSASPLWIGCAIGLLSIFSLAILINLVRGNRPDCNCFGQLNSQPIGPLTLVRNMALAAVAAGLALLNAGGHDRAPSEVLLAVLSEDRLQGYLLVAVATMAALQTWLCWRLLFQNGTLHLRLDNLENTLRSTGLLAEAEHTRLSGLPAGSVAPDFSLPSLNGQTTTLKDLRDLGKPIVLVFSDPNCNPCTALLPELCTWTERHADRLTFALVSRGTPAENLAKIALDNVPQVLLQRDREVSSSYGATATPSAVLVGVDGLIASEVVTGSQAIANFVSIAVGGHDQARGAAPRLHNPSDAVTNLQIGQPVPAFTLPSLHGEPVSSSAWRGQSTLLLFWNPACGFCTRMLAQFREFETTRRSLSPRLVVISTGDAEAVAANGFASTVLLDDQFTVGRTFGVNGTPSAVMLDADGTLASAVAVGAQRVLRLADSTAFVAQEASA